MADDLCHKTLSSSQREGNWGGGSIHVKHELGQYSCKTWIVDIILVSGIGLLQIMNFQFNGTTCFLIFDGE